MQNKSLFSGRVSLVSTLFLTLLFCCGATAQAGKVKDFAAKQVVIAPDGKIEHTGEIFASDGKMRMESFTPNAPEGMVVILRQDKKLQWMLNTKDKTYFERPLDENEFKNLMQSHVEEQSVKDLGTETVNGYTCQKKEMIVSVNFMGQKRTSKSTVWTSDQFDIPLRTRSENGNLTEMRDIKEGAQPASLFEIPADYKKVGNMMELFSNEKDSGEATGGQPPQIPEQFKGKLPKGFKMPPMPKQ